MAFDRLAPIAEPPHDPSSLLLDGHVGWQALSAMGVALGIDGALRLTPIAESLAAMANATGTLGGLVLPSNAVMTLNGTVLLLDRTSHQLHHFDPCECEFSPIACMTQYFSEPQGIGVYRSSLFVCDPQLETVLVFSLSGLALQGNLRPPTAEYPHWQPYGIAFDHRGRAFVTDRAAEAVHRFDCTGRWECALSGFTSPTWIAVDRRDRLFVTVGGGLEVRVTDAHGVELDALLTREVLASDFRALPFEIDDAGNMQLGQLCGSASSPEPRWFDAQGQPIPSPPAPDEPRYVTTGEVIIGALDSRIGQCVWHRAVVDAAIPQDARLVISTFTADEPYTAAQLDEFAEWATNLEVEGGGWDGLLRSAPGRYLWLKLILTSSGPSTPQVNCIEFEFPRIGSRRYLPAVFGAEPVSADFTDRFLALFDTTMRSIERQIDTQASLFDPVSAPTTRSPGTPTDFLSWLASWVGVSLERRWTEGQRRRFLKAAGELFDCRGTLSGLRRQLELLLGFDAYDRLCPRQPHALRCDCAPRNCAPMPACEPWTRPPLVLEHFRLRRWLYVGTNRLGSEARLWGNQIVNRTSLDANARLHGSQLVNTQDPLRDPYHVYAHKFTVFVPCQYRDSDAARRSLETLLKNESPAHTQHQLVFVEPRFRIGVQSMLGFDAVIGSVPTGVRLGETRLERAAVLTSKVTDGAAPLVVGRQGRIGTTARMG